MFYSNWYDKVKDIATDLQSSGLSFPVLHADKNIGVLLGKADKHERQQGLQKLVTNCQLGSSIGTRLLVLHLWGWPELDDNLTINLASLQDCLDIAAQYNMQLTLETIPCRKATPLQNMLVAIGQDSRSLITLDTEFLANHQQLDEVFTIEQLWLEQRVRHVHIKDYSGRLFTEAGVRNYLHPGDGHIDFPLFIKRLKEKNFNGTISLEAPASGDSGDILIQHLHKSLTFLQDLLSELDVTIL